MDYLVQLNKLEVDIERSHDENRFLRGKKKKDSMRYYNMMCRQYLPYQQNDGRRNLTLTQREKRIS